MIKHIVAGLDIGTSKAAVVIAGPSDDGSEGLKALGFAQADCAGAPKGVIADLPAVTEVLSDILRRAEKQAQRRITAAFVNVSGPQVKAESARGRSNILDKEKEISRKDLDNVAVNVKNTTLPYDRQAIHMIPQGYCVDGQKSINNPIGLFGTVLESDYYIISAPLSLILNLTKTVNLAGLEVEGIASTGMATGLSALTPQERQAGAMLLDIGGGITEAAVFGGGILKYSVILPFGAEDIAARAVKELRIAHNSAVKAIKRHGKIHLAMDMDTQAELLIKDADSALSVSKEAFGRIIEAGLKDIFDKAASRLEESGLSKPPDGGIVLTGGISMMDGAAEFAESVFGRKVRVASLTGIGGPGAEDMDISYMTAAGLARWGILERARRLYRGPRSSNPLVRAAQAARDFAADYF